MDIVDFLALSLAASAVVDLWRNGSLFTVARAYCEAREDGADEGITEDSLPPIEVEKMPEYKRDYEQCPYSGEGSYAWVEAQREAERAHKQAWSDKVKSQHAADNPRSMRVANALMPTWVAELLNCGFCLSHHTPWVLLLLCYLPSLFIVEPWAFLFKVPIYSLAATRISTILAAIVPQSVQYDRGDDFDEEFEYEPEPERTTQPDATDTGASESGVS